MLTFDLCQEDHTVVNFLDNHVGCTYTDEAVRSGTTTPEEARCPCS